MKANQRILALILAGVAGIASAETIYVDAAATGAGDGTSWADAYTTIQAAVDSAAFTSTSNATILVAEGVYPETVTLAADNSGSSGFPNRIAAVPGETVVIDGASTRNSGIVATSLAWFEFAGLTFTRTKSEGVKLTSSSNCTFDECLFNANKHGVYVVTGSLYTRYEDCRFTGSTTAGIYYSANATGEVFTNCQFVANALAMYTKAPSGQNVGVFRSVFSRNAAVAQVYAGGLAVDRCVFVENGLGIYLDHSRPVSVYNSIVAYNRGEFTHGQGSRQVSIYNCLLPAEGNAAVGSILKTVSGCVYGAPAFVDAFDLDFRLYADSDAIGIAAGGTDAGLHPSGVVALPTGATYFVRTDGHDTASGLNDTSDPATGAFATVSHAAAVATAPGDRVIVRAGAYSGAVVIHASGSATQPIRFEGDDAVLNAGAAHALTLSNSAHVVFSGFTAAGASVAGFKTTHTYVCSLSNLVADAGAIGFLGEDSYELTVADGRFSGNSGTGLFLNRTADCLYNNLDINRNNNGIGGTEGATNFRTRFTHCVVARNVYEGLGVPMNVFKYTVWNHCSIVANRRYGFNWNHNNNELRVTNSIVAYNGLAAADGSAGLFRIGGSLAWGNGMLGAQFVTNGVVSYSSPGFVSLADDDYRIFTDSAAYGGAADGSNLGADRGVVALPSAVHTYYIGPEGSDAADGLSPATAFASLTRASDAAAPGDTVNVAIGNYTGSWVWAASGSPTKPIAIQATGAVLTSTAGAALTLNAGFVALGGLSITNSAGFGLDISYAFESAIRNCSIDRSVKSGVNLWLSPLITLECCRAANGSSIGFDVIASPTVRFDRCVSSGNASTGIHVRGRNYKEEGGSFDAYTAGTLVRQCLFFVNRGNGTYLGASSPNMVVENTDIYGNTGHGFTGKSWGGQSITFRNTVIMANNIGIEKTGAGVSITEQNCDVFGNTLNYSGLTASPTSISADPLFRGASTGDFRLVSASPCVNIGLNQDWMRTAKDFAGNPRLAAKIVDIGAYEVSSSSTLLIVR